MKFDNRVTQMVGVEVPIVQALMGWIARSQLASAVSNAGGLGIIEMSSGELDQVAGRIDEVRSVKEIIDEVAEEFFESVGALSKQYLA